MVYIFDIDYRLNIDNFRLVSDFEYDRKRYESWNEINEMDVINWFCTIFDIIRSAQILIFFLFFILANFKMKLAFCLMVFTLNCWRQL